MRFTNFIAVLAILVLTGAIPTAALLSTQNLMQCSGKARWITQQIDHFGNHDATFQQKYYLDTQYYKPGGPVLLFHGEEGTVLDCINSTIMYDFARALGGVVVNLEHRYFGESTPFGPDLTQHSPDEWKFLTLDNVMQDAVIFVQSVRKNVTGNGSAPVFAASGSYGGFLMTMFRQNHPDTFKGVIASAPALRGFFGGNQTNVPDQHNWWNYISDVYRGQSALAATKISNAFDTLAERFASNNTSTLQSELGLCNPITDNSSTTLLLLSAALQQVYADGVEFNYASARPGRTPIANPLEKFIKIAAEENNPLQIINRTNWAWYPASAASVRVSYPCFNLSDPTQRIELTAPLISTIPFSYIACTYLQFSTSSAPNGTIFLPSDDAELINAAVSQQCQKQYGLTAPPSTEMYERYHFTDAELQNSTGIIFSLAEYDPTTAVSGEYSFEMPLRADVYASRRTLTTGMAHREDLFAQDEDTRQTVRHTNHIELETIKEWMNV